MIYELTNDNDDTLDYIYFDEQREQITLYSSLDYSATFNDQLRLKFYFVDQPDLQMNVQIILTVSECYFLQAYFETDEMKVDFDINGGS